ncbi:MAG: PEP-CTERM sorting domain-containing protein [Kiritimatiellae bacterium]|nr:PEP-CTERM sorting domain-containing protein [Kiritimatiellia bacterium]
MRKLVTALAVAGVAIAAMADTSWLDSYVYMWDSVGQADIWYDLNGSVQGQNFHGADLGTFTLSDTLWLNTEINANATGTDVYNYMSVYWRIGTSGGFTEQQDSELTDMGGGNWRGITGGGPELISEVSGPGTYTVQVYLERSHSWDGGGPYITQLDRDGDTGGGAPDNFFSATFEIIPEPASLLMLGAGLASLLVYRRRLR